MFERAKETIGRDALRELQLRKLRSLIDRLAGSPSAHSLLSEWGLSSSSDLDLDTLNLLPFMTKDDMVERYPDQRTLVSRNKIVAWHGSSGTGGRETLIPYSRRDVEVWSALCARLLVSAGVTKRSVVVNAYGLGLFTGGMGYQHGLGRLGATVIPLGLGPMARLVRLLSDMRVDTLACTPTYAARLVEYLSDTGIDPLETMNLRIGIFGAETFSEQLRSSLEQNLGLRAYDLYGLSEVTGPGVAGECQEREGLHVNEDHFILEIIDPTTGTACADGVTGEIVLTTLSKEAGPVLRYRTGDLASVSHSPCKCGRTFARISRIRGRRDDMIITNGVNVYPRDIEEAILALPNLTGDFVIVLAEQGSSAAVILCESTDTSRKTLYEAEAALAARIGMTLRLALIEPGTLERGDVKRSRRVVRMGTPEGARLSSRLDTQALSLLQIDR